MGDGCVLGKLPEQFLVRMEQMLGKEYEAFVQSYERERTHGLRFHGGKGRIQELYERYKELFGLRQIPWCQEGFYYQQEARPGKSPLHEAGLYYIQEPSAMGAVPLLDPQPGERMLDLCAAPGGKTTQAAERLGFTGLLVSNEIHAGRAKILSANVERMGFINTVVVNESSEDLAEAFPEFFDRILIDAPCSGEGMFRKDEQARLEWSEENVRLCAARQREILDNGARLLRPGGRMAYSTCTFSPEENEQQIEAFLERHPEFSVVRIPSENGLPGLSPGRPEWTKNSCRAVENTFRIWPHLTEGEGHYLALLEKEDDREYRAEGRENKTEEPKHRTERREYKSERKSKNKLPERERQDKEKPWEDPAGRRILREFLEELLWADGAAFQELSLREMEKNLILFGQQVYRIPEEMPRIKGRKVLRPGLHLGTLKKNRFEPSHGLAKALHPAQVKRKICLEPDDKRVGEYLSGHTLRAEDGLKGWVLVCVGEYPLGWGKAAGGVLKNHYPKGLRLNLPPSPLQPNQS